MAEITKPSTYPRFASTGNAYGHENDVVAEPSEGKKSQGWFARIPPLPYDQDATQDMPPFRWMNWILRWAYKWIPYLENKIDISLGNTADATLTISSGAITPSKENHSVQTEGGVSRDELTNIVTTNLKDGRLLLLRLASDNQEICIAHAAGGAGQIFLQNGWDMYFTAPNQGILLQRAGSDWYEIAKWGFEEDRIERASFVPLLWYSLGLPHRKFGNANERVTVGNNPTGLIFDGKNVWSLNNGASTMTKFNPTTGAVLATVTLAAAPYLGAFDGSFLWVTLANNTVVKINPETNLVVATVTGFNQPKGIAIAAGSPWVCNMGNNRLVKIDPETNVIDTDFPTQASPHGLAYDGHDLHVVCNGANSVDRYNAETETFTANYAVGNGPLMAAFDGSSMWITNSTAGTVSKYNCQETGGSVIATVTVGNAPGGIGFDGTHIIVSNSADDTISKINVNENIVKATLASGDDPGDIAFDGIHTWVACKGTSDYVKKYLTRNRQ